MQSNIADVINEAAGSVSRGIKMYAKSKVIASDHSIVTSRVEICRGCESLEDVYGMEYCTKCLCAMWLKVRLASSRCPIGKWEPSEI
jgi:hypothetical protein